MNLVESEGGVDRRGNKKAAGINLNENDEIFCRECYAWKKVKQLGIEIRTGTTMMREMTLLYCLGGEDALGNIRPDHDASYIVSTP